MKYQVIEVLHFNGSNDYKFMDNIVTEINKEEFDEHYKDMEEVYHIRSYGQNKYYNTEVKAINRYVYCGHWKPYRYKNKYTM